MKGADHTNKQFFLDVYEGYLAIFWPPGTSVQAVAALYVFLLSLSFGECNN
jgi:hypothetical protein